MEDPGAACIIQPLSTVMNAVDRLGDLEGKSVAVMGLGSIGLLFCWLAKRGGASSVVGIDPVPGRCRFAETLGATQTICSRGIETVQMMRTSPEEWIPPDICIEAVGHQMDTINDCLELVRKYGTVVAFGVPDHPVYALEYEIFFRKNACSWERSLRTGRNISRKRGSFSSQTARSCRSLSRTGCRSAKRQKHLKCTNGTKTAS